MDVIEVITQIADASIGIAALVVLAVVVMSWAKGRGADNDVITTMAALLTNSQAGLEELGQQTAASNAALTAIQVALERSNAIDERTIEALNANTAVIEHNIADNIVSREAMQEQVTVLATKVDGNRDELLARLDALEASVIAGFSDLGSQMKELHAARALEERSNQTEMNKTLGDMLSVIHELRRLVQIAEPQSQTLQKAA